MELDNQTCEKNCSVAKINNLKEGDDVPLCEGCGEIFSRLDCGQCQKEFLLTGVVPHSHDSDDSEDEEMETRTPGDFVFGLGKLFHAFSLGLFTTSFFIHILYK